MAEGRIESRANERLKRVRRARRARGDQAVLEGPHLIAEALRSGTRLEFVLATESFLESVAGRSLAATLPHPPIPIRPKLLDAIADSDSPRGVVALAERPVRDIAALEPRDHGTYLYLDGVQDPGNVGAVARVAEAAGARAIILGPGCAAANHPRALRGSAGSLLRVPTARASGVGAVDAALEALQPTWVALATRDGEDLYRASLDGTLVLALGAEGSGLSAESRARAERALTIPLQSGVESLNVATSAAVVLFELLRRRSGPRTAPATASR